MPSSTNPNDEQYWADYDGLQYVKHQLLIKYLGGWFPILCSWSGRVLYVDCNAGRGRHKTGHEGSPILALKTLLNHCQKATISKNAQVSVVFFENNPVNYDYLISEIRLLGDLPKFIDIKTYKSDYEIHLMETIIEFQKAGQQHTPALIFVDPYGFKLSMGLLNRLLSFERCELFINFMYRYVDMAMHNLAQANNLDELFGNPNWRFLVDIQESDVRAKQIIGFFSKQLNAQYVTHMLMLGNNNVIKYVLLHASNHRRGRELIKDVIWSIVPDGIFEVSERRNPNQMILINPEPDLRFLKDRLWEDFTGCEVKMTDLYNWLLEEPFRKPHLHTILTEYRNNHIVTFNNRYDRIAFNNNPLIGFPSKRPKEA